MSNILAGVSSDPLSSRPGVCYRAVKGKLGLLDRVLRPISATKRHTETQLHAALKVTHTFIAYLGHFQGTTMPYNMGRDVVRVFFTPPPPQNPTFHSHHSSEFLSLD